MRLLDDYIDASLVEQGDRATWQIRNMGPERLPAINDFQVTAALVCGARYLGVKGPPLEVHLAHSEPTDAAEYARVFQAPVRLGAECNAVVMPRFVLDLPVVHANPDLFAAFDAQAQRMLEQLPHAEPVTVKVRRLVVDQLKRGDTGMEAVANQLHMSVATLRRRLDEEGKTHRELVDEARRELALRHIIDRRIAISEIAFLLGFSSVNAFGRAFRRWTGSSPLDYRARLNANAR
jgi:AraC-like DNA-binding protein